MVLTLRLYLCHSHCVSPALGLKLPVLTDPQAFFLLVSDKPLIIRIRVQLVNLGPLWVLAFLHSSDDPSS